MVATESSAAAHTERFNTISPSKSHQSMQQSNRTQRLPHNAVAQSTPINSVPVKSNFETRSSSSARALSRGTRRPFHGPKVAEILRILNNDRSVNGQSTPQLTAPSQRRPAQSTASQRRNAARSNSDDVLQSTFSQCHSLNVTSQSRIFGSPGRTVVGYQMWHKHVGLADGYDRYMITVTFRSRGPPRPSAVPLTTLQNAIPCENCWDSVSETRVGVLGNHKDTVAALNRVWLTQSAASVSTSQ